ncbi:DJ-1/PfpI family protein [Micromonospora kangleipakensis]|nr:DJ-1/PfpI family protein [Micromonospora kangleipakensis]
MFVYNDFAEFEVAILVTAMRATKHSLTTVGPTRATVTSIGRLSVQPDAGLADIDAADYDALIIPGGVPTPLLENPLLADLIRTMGARDSLLAAICGGPALLGAAGALDGVRYTASLGPDDDAYAGIVGRGTQLAQPLVVDGNIITATGSNYLGFAEEVLRHLDGASTITPLTYFREVTLA